MTDFLLKIFIKDYKNFKDTRVREKYGIFSSVVGVFINIILTSIKITAGLISGSIAIVADALNNLSDAGSSIISFIGFKMSARPADRNHPFGHARMEYVSSMIVSFLILIVGFELLTESLKGLFDKKTEIIFSLLTFIILGISILLKLWLAFFYRKISKKIDSSVIKASAADSFSDVISTFSVLVSAIIVKFTNIWFIDSIVGIAVSIIILIAGGKILNETKNSLLGEAPVKETIDNIKSIVSKYDEILGVHDMMVHNYGPNHYIASFHAEVDGSKDIFILHDAVDNLEKEINETYGIECTIHMDPVLVNDELTDKLKEIALKCVKNVCAEANIHDFRIVVGNTHTNLIFDVLIPFENKEKDDVIKDKIKKEILDVNSKYYSVIKIDRG